MEPPDLLKALKTLRDQFASFKVTSIQERNRLQGQLDLSREQNRGLEAQLAERTREVHELRKQLADQAARKEELEIVKSIEAEFAEYRQTWTSEQAKDVLKDEVDNSRALDAEMFSRASDREIKRITVRSQYLIIAHYCH